MSIKNKIVLSGYYGFDNIGDEAVLFSIITALRQEIENVHITVLSNNPDKTKALYGVESVNRWDLKVIRKVLKESDLLISGGGSLLQDVTSGKTVPYYLAIVKMAQFYKKKVVFYSQGIGPLNKSYSRWMVKKVVNKVSGVFVRDAASKALLEEIGVSQSIGAALDPVLGIQLPQGQVPQNMKKETKSVGIYLRPWKDKEHDDHLKGQLMPSLIDLMKKGYTLYFIPMHFEQDREIAKELAAQLQEATKGKLEDKAVEAQIQVVDRLLSIQEVLAYTQRFDLVIGMRLHSLIMAAATATPMVALSYDPKVTEFMKEMALPYCLDSETVTSEALEKMVDEVEGSIEKQREHLQYMMDKQRERIYLPVKRIKELLEQQ